MTPRVYLAGPEVFLPEANEIASRKKAICTAHGLQGAFPLDANLDLSAAQTKPDAAAMISRANEDLMRSCDAIIANCTPFRGTGMDVGTAFEVGFMRALGRPCFCYSNQPGSYLDRANAYRETAGRNGPLSFDGDRRDTEIEDFDLAENLMIAIAARESGTGIITPASNEAAGDIAGLDVFEACVEKAALIIARG